jgi:hypothetical protein
MICKSVPIKHNLRRDHFRVARLRFIKNFVA